MSKNEDKDFRFNIEEFIGAIKESDKHDWAKAVLRITWGDNPTTVDIRNVNMSNKRIGKGISLSNEEANRLVGILLDNDFGTLKELESAIARKRQFFSITNEIEDMLIEGDDMYTIDIK